MKLYQVMLSLKLIAAAKTSAYESENCIHEKQNNAYDKEIYVHEKPGHLAVA